MGLEKPNLGRDRGETFFPDSGSDLDSDETFQISLNLGLDIDEIVCLLDSQLCVQLTIKRPDPRQKVMDPQHCLELWVSDPGSGIRDPEKTYSGSRIQGSKRHQISDPQHCFKVT